MTPTLDPDVWITEQGEDWLRYVNVTTGRTWRVDGKCDKRGDCLIGAVIDGELVQTIERAHQCALAWSGPDVPVTPEFKGCCPFKFTEP